MIKHKNNGTWDQGIGTKGTWDLERVTGGQGG